VTEGYQNGFECQCLNKQYETRSGPIFAIEDVSFIVRHCEFVCIVGPSGCGKTTLLKLIAGLVQPTSGRIVFGREAGSSGLRSALVFQEHGLFPWMTVLDNVAFGLEMLGVDRRERIKRAGAFIETVGLTSFSHNYPAELSVGMRQRVGIARAFVADPRILLMDEPFGSLDAQTRAVLQHELLRIWREHQKSVVFVTHDVEEALLLGDRVIVMSGRPGRILEQFPVIVSRPRDRMEGNDSELKEIRWKIWTLLEQEVRKGLAMPY